MSNTTPHNTGMLKVKELILVYADNLQPVLDNSGLEIKKPNNPLDPDYIADKLDFCLCPDGVHNCVPDVTIVPTVTPTTVPTVAPTTAPTIVPTTAPTLLSCGLEDTIFEAPIYSLDVNQNNQVLVRAVSTLGISRNYEYCSSLFDVWESSSRSDNKHLIKLGLIEGSVSTVKVRISGCTTFKELTLTVPITPTVAPTVVPTVSPNVCDVTSNTIRTPIYSFNNQGQRQITLSVVDSTRDFQFLLNGVYVDATESFNAGEGKNKLTATIANYALGDTLNIIARVKNCGSAENTLTVSTIVQNPLNSGCGLSGVTWLEPVFQYPAGSVQDGIMIIGVSDSSRLWQFKTNLAGATWTNATIGKNKIGINIFDENAVNPSLLSNVTVDVRLQDINCQYEKLTKTFAIISPTAEPTIVPTVAPTVTPTVAPTIVLPGTTNPANGNCNNNDDFSISAVSYSNNALIYDFNANNLGRANWYIYKGLQLIAHNEILHTNHLTTISALDTLSDGEYMFILQGISCNGSAQKAFTVGTITPTVAPTSVPTIAPTVVVGASFTNKLKTVDVETVVNTFSPDKFLVNEIPTGIDSVIGVEYPLLPIQWQVENSNFARTNTTTQSVGIPFNLDMTTGYGSYAVRGLDFVLPQDPSNGCFWGQSLNSSFVCTGVINDVDTVAAAVLGATYVAGQSKTYQNFVTRIPLKYRSIGMYGVTGDSPENENWNNKDLNWLYNKGANVVAANHAFYGFGDYTGGRYNLGLYSADIENNYETGEQGTNKHLAFSLGMASRVKGYSFTQYYCPFFVAFLNPSAYPIDEVNGAYSATKVNVDGTPKYWNGPNGTDVQSSLEPNNTPNNPEWRVSNKINIDAFGTTSVGLIDEPRAIACTEVAHLSTAKFKQGELVDLKNHYDANGDYDINNPTQIITVNKFGVNANVVHPVAKLINALDVTKYYMKKFYNDRLFFTQVKVTCDASNLGIFYEGGFTNEDLQHQQLTRDYGLHNTMLTGLSGSGIQLWDRNTHNVIIDSYNGVVAGVNLLLEKKAFANGITKSFAELRKSANFLLWNSEISYDNGATWKKEKAHDYVMNMTSIPQRQFVTSDGYWGMYLARPELVESTSCKLRVWYNGSWYYHTITPSMWETTNPTYKNTPLANIPDSGKHYYYNIIKLSDPITPTIAPTTDVTIVPTTAPVGTVVPLFIFHGESNSFGQAENSELPQGALGVKNGIKIWNRNTSSFETLNIASGGNNTIGDSETHNDRHGWEYGISKKLGTSLLPFSDVRIVKAGKSGATIGQFNDGANPRPNYWNDDIKPTIEAAINAIVAEGKTPDIYVFYSQGINDAIYSNAGFGISASQWYTNTVAHFTKLRQVVGANTPIITMKLFGNYGTYANASINNIVNLNTEINYSFETDNANHSRYVNPAYHFDAAGTEQCSIDYLTIVKSIMDNRT